MKRLAPMGFIALLSFEAGVSSAARAPLTFEERVKAQEAIERVYYSHRIWPKENPTPKPPFEEMVPRAVIEAKVTDYLKKCAALDKYWQRPITPEQLQAEMDRMAKATRDPGVLRKLYSALGDDPYVVAQCLARPLLADRLIRNWYSADPRFEESTEGSAEVSPANEREFLSAPRRSFESWWEKVRGGIELASPGDGHGGGEYRAALPWVETSGWQDVGMSRIPDPTSYGTCIWTGTEMIAWGGSSQVPVNWGGRYTPATDTWQPTSREGGCPAPRRAHSAVWTGTEMIVWGGEDGGGHARADGGIYSPSTDSWRPTSTGPNCPAPRRLQTALWTGTEMIVWGGLKLWEYEDGGRYSPASDTWTPVSTGAGHPSARAAHTAVWTGTQMIIWGGAYNGDPVKTGARYTPASDSWQATSTAGSCPSIRGHHTAVWTGTRMIVWGGGWADSSNNTNTGAQYDPAADTWTATSTGANCPAARYDHTAVWTGTEMIVWGGGDYLQSGGRYNPATDNWRTTSTGVNCPTGRSDHGSAWTGSEMLIWGGGGRSTTSVGGRYSPSADSWVPLAGGPPGPRENHVAVWTGSEMLVWGGNSILENRFLFEMQGFVYHPSTDTWAALSQGTGCPGGASWSCGVWSGTEMIVWGGGVESPQVVTDQGGRYNPTTDSWKSTPAGSPCPSARSSHTGVWTGTDLIVWGGLNSYGYGLQTGGRYAPSTDSWKATSEGENCPSKRGYHSAVWTGSEMVVWGGQGVGSTGGRYSPLTDSWLPTSDGSGCPAPRMLHTAVWTGSEMVIWGGYDNGYLSSGALYDLAHDSWRPTSTGSGCPSPRQRHTAVWTGDEMIIWGGFSWQDGDILHNSGGRYFPSVDRWSPTPVGERCPSPRKGHSAVWAGDGMVVWGGGYTDTLSNGGIYVPEPACLLTCDASGTPSSGESPLEVAFLATISAQGCAGSPSYLWSFGDGATSTEHNPTHTYAAAGSFPWTLTAMADDQTCTQAGTVAVSEGCAVSCTASATPASGAAPRMVSFAASATPSNCTGTPTFAWTFGDGAASAEQNPSHTYAAPGTFSWTMTVTVEGRTCTQTGTVTVVPPCVLACDATATPDHGAAPLSVAFAATVDASDCPGSPVFLWSFGDGETSSEPTPGHTYAEPGTYAWSCTVTAGGKACSASGSLAVNPGIPGDGNNDGVVSIGEVQQAINMFLEVQPPGNGADCNGDGSVSIGEVQKVINAFLGLAIGC